MSVMLSVVHKDTGESAPNAYLFDEDRVTIGRGEENDLTLPDPKKAVCNEHALIERAGETYQLIDRNSNSLTRVGDKHLNAGEPYPLREGDIFHIGDFRIEYTQPTQDARAPNREELEEDIENPFESPLDQLTRALEALQTAYEDTATAHRDDVLADALRAADPPPEVRTAVQQTVGDVERVSAEETATLDAPLPTDTATGSEDVPTEPTEAASAQSSAGPLSPSTDRSPPARRAEHTPVLDTLAASLAKVLPIPDRFRHEFTGHTVTRPPETQFLYEGDGDTIKEHLTDPSVPEDERRNRLGYVDAAVESLAAHQVAMLNGYKACVQEGVKALLDQFDPIAHQDALRDDNALFECLPILTGPAVLKRIRANVQDLYGDWSAVEQRIFRPAFTKAYLAHMTASESADSADS